MSGVWIRCVLQGGTGDGRVVEGKEEELAAGCKETWRRRGMVAVKAEV